VTDPVSDLGPVRLPANQPPRFYLGGAAIAALRGTAAKVRTEHGPEDWVASTTTLFGARTAGLSTLPDGRWLRDAVRDHPVEWLGTEHITRHGADPALLVKLLDAGQRLPVHCHPDDVFANRHLGSHYGKTEAWVIIGTTGDHPTVHIGFQADVDQPTVADWVSRQDSAALLSALNPVPVRPGDTVFIPAGLPHAIGAGVFIVELQQPTDLSITLEWRDFLGGAAEGHLGIGFDTALACVDRSGYDEQRLASLIRRGGNESEAITDLFPAEAAAFFQAQRVTPGAELPPSFAVLVALAGIGTLRTERGADVDVHKGDTLVVPYASGTTELTGDLVAVRALPPQAGGGHR
jgi:mannose-6-phosphate isomerase